MLVNGGKLDIIVSRDTFRIDNMMMDKIKMIHFVEKLYKT